MTTVNRESLQDQRKILTGDRKTTGELRQATVLCARILRIDVENQAETLRIWALATEFVATAPDV